MALGFQPSPAGPTARPQSVWDYTRLADADLLALVAEDRDQVAFEEFFSHYSRSVYSMMVRQLGDAGWADDVVQEAFISVWRVARTHRPERGAVVGWLYTIARNAGYAAARRRQAQWLVDAPDRADPSPTPEDWTAGKTAGVQCQGGLLRLTGRRAYLPAAPGRLCHVSERARDLLAGLPQGDVPERDRVRTAHAPG